MISSKKNKVLYKHKFVSFHVYEVLQVRLKTAVKLLSDSSFPQLRSCLVAIQHFYSHSHSVNDDFASSLVFNGVCNWAVLLFFKGSRQYISVHEQIQTETSAIYNLACFTQVVFHQLTPSSFRLVFLLCNMYVNIICLYVKGKRIQ